MKNLQKAYVSVTLTSEKQSESFGGKDFGEKMKFYRYPEKTIRILENEFKDTTA